MSNALGQGIAKYVYRVTRWERVTYVVATDEPIEKDEHLYALLLHPDETVIERESIQQVKP